MIKIMGRRHRMWNKEGTEMSDTEKAMIFLALVVMFLAVVILLMILGICRMRYRMENNIEARPVHYNHHRRPATRRVSAPVRALSPPPPDPAPHFAMGPSLLIPQRPQTARAQYPQYHARIQVFPLRDHPMDP